MEDSGGEEEEDSGESFTEKYFWHLILDVVTGERFVDRDIVLEYNIESILTYYIFRIDKATYLEDQRKKQV